MPTEFNILDFGARGDGVTNDAPAVQSAIDACHAHGGGTVLVPAGATYLSGSLVLRSFVELHVETGATLAASGRWEDITERFTVSALSSGVVREDVPAGGAFLTAKGAQQISITGGGIVDGGGRHYVEDGDGPIYRMPKERPFTVFFVDCRNVTLRDTTYRDGALWTLRLTGCEDVVVHAVRIDGDLALPNCDGIDLDRCRNVRISDCNISCGDDAISLKTCEEFPDSGPCENIVVTNCVLRTTSSALVVGVDSAAPIRNVLFDNCVIRSSHRGLSVNMGQVAAYENIVFSNIVVETQIFDDRWWGRGEPIYVSAVPWHEEDGVGTVKNVRFTNILARSENGVYISGSAPGLIDGIVLENVRVELDRWTDHAGGRYDRRPAGDGRDFDVRPTAAFHIDTASNVVLRNCEAVWGPNPDEHFGPALETIDTPGLLVEGFVGEPAHGDPIATES